jgi:hypothetical protein
VKTINPCNVTNQGERLRRNSKLRGIARVCWGYQLNAGAQMVASYLLRMGQISRSAMPASSRTAARWYVAHGLQQSRRSDATLFRTSDI